MKELGFFPSPADPCLFIEIEAKDDHPAFIIIYVDDGLITGAPDIIKTVLKALAKESKLKTWDQLKILLVVKFLSTENVIQYI
jgi:hypothetical protein